MYGRRTSSDFSSSTTLRIFYRVSQATRARIVLWTYLNRPETGSVTGGHILVESIDGGNAGHLTVLLVHVVGTGARVVADPDAKVLDLLRALLVNLEQVSLLSFIIPQNPNVPG